MYNAILRRLSEQIGRSLNHGNPIVHNVAYTAYKAIEKNEQFVRYAEESQVSKYHDWLVELKEIESEFYTAEVRDVILTLQEVLYQYSLPKHKG